MHMNNISEKNSPGKHKSEWITSCIIEYISMLISDVINTWKRCDQTLERMVTNSVLVPDIS